MKIVVCVKQVPGTNNVEVDPVTGTLRRDGVESKMNPYDLYALELGLQLRDQYGGSVHVVSMGPNQAKAVLLEAVYMGADGGILLSDRKFAGADVLATSYTLVGGLKTLDFDLILCGKQTTDGDTAQVGPEMAEFLGIDHATNVTQVLGLDETQITVRLNLENSVQVQQMKLPCLLCADKEINTPRLPSFRRKLQVQEAECIRVISLADFSDQDELHYGLNGSPTHVEQIFPPEKKKYKEIYEGSGPELAESAYELLLQKKFI